VISTTVLSDFAYSRHFHALKISREDRRAHARVAKAGIPGLAPGDCRAINSQVFREKPGRAHKARSSRRFRRAADIRLYANPMGRPRRGPHVPSNGKLRAFKLMKIAGAYARTRFQERDDSADLRHGLGRTRKQLKAYLTRLEEAERRGAIIVRSARSRTCFTSRRNRPVPYSGTPKGGRCSRR